MPETVLTRDLTKEEVAEFKEAFDMFDIDGGGMYDCWVTGRRKDGEGLGWDVFLATELVNRRILLTIAHFWFLPMACLVPFDEFSISQQHFVGTIESSELSYVMSKLGEKPTDDELEDMIRAVDLNGDGEIDFEEFISLMRLRMDERQRDPEEDLRDAFNMFDADRSGFIDRDEVRALMKKLAQTLTEDEIGAIMDEVDTDGDGEISFDEFRAMMFS